MSNQQPSPSLRVLTGLHAGAVCLLPDGRFSIGSEPPANILLGDEHVAPRHIVVDRDENGLRLAIEADGVAIEGTRLAAGDVVAAVLPVSISIGGVELRCEAGEAVAPPRRSLSWPIGRRRISAVGAGAALAATLLVAAAIVPAATNAFAAPRAKQSASLPARLPQAGMAVSDATLQSETQQQLKANGLSDISLTVSNSVVTAQGQLGPGSGDRMHNVELWFDHRFGEAAVFISQVSTRAPRKFTIPLDAVWAGPDPNVVVRGQKYYVGASLPGGATIDKITQRQVLVSQEGQHYAVNY